jgi:hypothetical protein
MPLLILVFIVGTAVQLAIRALAAGEVVAAIGALGMVAMTAFIALRLLTRRKQ